MDLSPNDIRNYRFPSQMRGYDKAEVDNLLERIAAALEEARQQNLKLSMQVDSLKTQFTALKEFEDTIKNAAIDARRNADATIANAKKEGMEIIAKAKIKLEELSGEYKAKETEVEKQMVALEQVKRSYISKLRALINSHLDMVDEIATADVKKEIHGESECESESKSESKSEIETKPAKPAPPPDPNGIEVTESEDMTRQKLETLADQPGEELDEPGETDETCEDEEAKGVEDAQSQPEEPEPAPKSIDPELAAALEQYKMLAARKAAQLDPEDFGPAPPPGTIIETDSSAEDIPPGFIAKIADAELKRSRPVVSSQTSEYASESEEDQDPGLAPDAQDRPTEHNAIDMDRPTRESKARAIVSPDELAAALDSAVERLEKEFAKAEKR